jgi:uncharacterized metal-binding protein YceD (DUF177 family)
MENLSAYQINLLNLRKNTLEKDYQIDDQFFAAVESPEVTQGSLKTHLLLKKMADGSFELTLSTKGTVKLICDRCLDEMDQEIDTENTLKIKWGTEYSEDDDTLTVSEREGQVDVSSFIYQFIMLDIPIKHVHAPGKCNAEMMDRYKHLAVRRLDGEEAEELGNEDEEDAGESGRIDPRWSELLKIKK